MRTCRDCGQDVVFRYINGVCTPIHLHGLPCGERPPYSDEALRSAVRCRCPLCQQMVYLVRHNGGSFWVDELGWPWPLHPCFDAATASLRSASTVPDRAEGLVSGNAGGNNRQQPATIADFEHALYIKLNQIPVDDRRQRYCIHDLTKKAEFNHLSRHQMEEAGREILTQVPRPAITRTRQRSVPPKPAVVRQRPKEKRRRKGK